MIIKINPVTYLHASANKDVLEFMKLPVVTSNNARRVEDMINYTYLKDNKVKFKKIVGPHVVSLAISTDTSTEDSTVYVEFYKDSKTLAKLCLLNLLERSKYAKGSLLENLIRSDSLFRNMTDDFSTDIIAKATSVFVEAVESLEGLECVNVLTTINLLNRDDFKIVVDLITGELQKIYKLEYCSTMNVEELNEKLISSDLFYKYFIKQIRIDVPSQDTNHCFGSVNASTTIIPYFNIGAIVDDSALVERDINLYENLVADLKELETYLPISTHKELDGAIQGIILPRVSSDFDQRIYQKLMCGELIKASLSDDEFCNDDDVFDASIRKCIESL